MAIIIDTPAQLARKYPATENILLNIAQSRDIIKSILGRKDSRMLLIMGPCSFHDPDAAFDYAVRLKKLSALLADKFYIVMRVFVEKPRTGLGWKGYLNDPLLNDTNDMQQGIINSRKFMLQISELGVPIACEILNPIAHLYYSELLSWATIGARTAESQPHREIASNISLPLGFKNTTTGNIDTAINAIKFAAQAQTFLTVNYNGQTEITTSKGNSYTHLVLRGSAELSNYSDKHVAHARKLLCNAGLPTNILVDCSHGNSTNDYKQQITVFNDILQQRTNGCDALIGAMLESFIESGSQKIKQDLAQLKYGVSVTDNCLSWEMTEQLLLQAYAQLTSAEHEQVAL